MTALTWAALAIGLVLLPGAARGSRRAQVLADLGRVSRSSSDPSARPLPWGRVGSIAAASGVVCVGLAGGVVLAAAAGIVCATVASVVAAALRAKSDRRADVDLLAAVRAMVAEVEAGGAPAAAFDAAAQACPTRAGVFADAAAACRRGEVPQLPGDVSRSEGIGSAGHAASGVDADLSGLAHSWRLAVETGAPLAGVLARLAEHVAARIDQHRAVAAALSGPRSSAALLAGLPVLGLGLGAAMQADPVGVLVGTPSGRLLCLVGVALDAAGVLWTYRLTARAARG